MTTNKQNILRLKNKGYSQIEISISLNLSQGYISKVLKEKKHSIKPTIKPDKKNYLLKEIDKIKQHIAIVNKNYDFVDKRILLLSDKLDRVINNLNKRFYPQGSKGLTHANERTNN